MMHRRQKGVGLIETMITVLFIAVSVIALIRFQNSLAYNDSLAQQQNEANIIGTKQLETLRDFQVLNTTTGYAAYQDIVSGTSTATGLNTTYNLAWTVTSYTNPTYKNINLTVSWTDRYNAAQSIQLITNVAGIDPSYSATIMY